MKCENIDTTVAVCPGGSGLIDGSLEGRLTDNSFDNPVLIFRRAKGSEDVKAHV